MTYWEGKGKYQEDYDVLFDHLVPQCGQSETEHGELIRNVSCLYYDLYNNGLGNLDIIYDQWKNLYFWHLEFCGDEISVDELKRIDVIFDMWLKNFDESGDVPDYDVLINHYLGDLMEKLANAVILYVKGKEDDSKNA